MDRNAEYLGKVCRQKFSSKPAGERSFDEKGMTQMQERERSQKAQVSVGITRKLCEMNFKGSDVTIGRAIRGSTAFDGTLFEISSQQHIIIK